MTVATVEPPPKRRRRLKAPRPGSRTPLRAADLGVIAPREPLSVAEWAREHLKVTEGPMMGAHGTATAWSPLAFPLQTTILAAIGDPRWGKVYLMTSPQAFGKTLCAALPTLLHGVHHREVNALYVAANSHLAVTQWRKKIEPAMKATPALAELLTLSHDEAGGKERRDFANGASLHCAGSESVANLSAFTTPVVVCDDLQAYPATLPGFGHPADVAWARSGAYPATEKTHVGIGTAGTVEDYLWRSMASSALYCPLVPCLTCGTFQILEWSRLVFDETDLAAARADTFLACADSECDHQIRFEELPAMLTRHQWVSCPPGADWVCNPPDGGVRFTAAELAEADCYPATSRNTNVAGFWANALYWPIGDTWGERVADFLGRRGDPDKLRDHQQTVRVVPWKAPEVDEQRITEEEVAEHLVTGYRAGQVPAAADVVTITVDVQSGYVYYLVRGWRQADGTSWLLELGTCGRPRRDGSAEERRARRGLAISSALDQVAAKAQAGWDRVDAAGQVVGKLVLAAGLIDVGFEPDIVALWWLSKHRGVWHMIRGEAAGRGGALWPLKPNLDKRGRPYRRVDVNQAKHLLRKLLRIAQGQAGYWHMPSEGLHINTLRAYAKHMASERFDRTMRNPRWVQITPGSANHFWDCETYQISAAVMAGVMLPEVGEARRRPMTLREWKAGKK